LFKFSIEILAGVEVKVGVNDGVKECVIVGASVRLGVLVATGVDKSTFVSICAAGTIDTSCCGFCRAGAQLTRVKRISIDDERMDFGFIIASRETHFQYYNR